MAKPTTKNRKEITLYIRVNSGLKRHLETKATEVGLRVSSYARMKLVEVSGFKGKAM